MRKFFIIFVLGLLSVAASPKKASAEMRALTIAECAEAGGDYAMEYNGWTSCTWTDIGVSIRCKTISCEIADLRADPKDGGSKGGGGSKSSGSKKEGGNTASSSSGPPTTANLTVHDHRHPAGNVSNAASPPPAGSASRSTIAVASATGPVVRDHRHPPGTPVPSGSTTKPVIQSGSAGGGGGMMSGAGIKHQTL